MIAPRRNCCSRPGPSPCRRLCETHGRRNRRDFSLIPTGFRRNPLSYRRLAMILASISGGLSLGKPLPDLSRRGQSLCEGPFSVSCRKSKPFKPSDAVGFDEKSLEERDL